MSNWIKPFIIGLLLGGILGIIVGLFSLELLHINPVERAGYGVLEIVYYLVTPIGVLATLFAVIVALFGNEIKSYLFRERSFSQIPNNFSEVLRNEDDDNPEALRYECNLRVRSNCGREISECAVYLIQVEYKDSDNARWKSLGIQNRIPIYWQYPNIEKKTITATETATLTLLKITPDISQSKSDSSDTTNIPRQISIVGYKSLNTKYSKRGYWKITYCVSNSHRELERFEIIVHWSGEWKKREKEMNNETSLEMIRTLK